MFRFSKYFQTNNKHNKHLLNRFHLLSFYCILMTPMNTCMYGSAILYRTVINGKFVLLNLIAILKCFLHTDIFNFYNVSLYDPVRFFSHVQPFIRFRRVARAVKLLIQVCHVCKGYVTLARGVLYIRAFLHCT